MPKPVTKSMGEGILQLLRAYDNFHELTVQYGDALQEAMDTDKTTEEITELENLWDTAYSMESTALHTACKKIMMASRKAIDYPTARTMITEPEYRRKLNRLLDGDF